MKNYDYEVVTIAKKVVLEDGSITYVPIDIVEGRYDSSSELFVDSYGNKYAHIINNVDIGFFGRKNMNDLKIMYKHLNPFMIKKVLLHWYKKNYYFYYSEDDTELNTPFISMCTKKSNHFNYLDYDMKKYYLKNYPSYYNYLVDSGDVEEDFLLKEIAINKLDKETIMNLIGDEIIDGRRNYKEIVDVFYSHLTCDDNHNMLINTDDTTSCLEIIRLISYTFNLPVVNLDFNSIYKLDVLNNKMCVLLEKIVEVSNYDINKAQLGVIVFNDIDNILLDSVDFLKMQDMLVDVINEGGKITIGDKECKFVFDNILVIGVGNWNKVNRVGYINNAISEFNKEEVAKFDMRKKLCDKFTNFIEVKEKEEFKKKNLHKID